MSAAAGAQLVVVVVVVAVLYLRMVVGALWYLLPGTRYGVGYVFLFPPAPPLVPGK